MKFNINNISNIYPNITKALRNMSNKEKIVISLIVGWFFIHSIIFSMAVTGDCMHDIGCSNEEWFHDTDCVNYVKIDPYDRFLVFNYNYCYYDLFEFLIYAIAPIISYVIYKALSRYK